MRVVLPDALSDAARDLEDVAVLVAVTVCVVVTVPVDEIEDVREPVAVSERVLEALAVCEGELTSDKDGVCVFVAVLVPVMEAVDV